MSARRADRSFGFGRFRDAVSSRRGLFVSVSLFSVMSMIALLGGSSQASWVFTEHVTSNLRTQLLVAAEPTTTPMSPIAVGLEWTLDNARGDEQYTVERATSATGQNAVKIATGLSDLTYTDEGPIAAVSGACVKGAVLLSTGKCSLTQQANYWYRVSYTVGSWTGPASDWVKVTIPARDALIPSGVAEANQVTLSWDKAPYAGITAATYKLERTLNSDGTLASQVYSGPNRTYLDYGGTIQSVQPFGQVVAAASRTCALMEATGQVYCWGRRSSGTTVAPTEPTVVNPIDALGGFKAMTLYGQRSTADIEGANSGFCVLSSTRKQVACWQMMFPGQSGALTVPGGVYLDPVAVYGVDTLVSSVGKIKEISLGQLSRCLLTDSSKVFCWGGGWNGGLGDGGTYNYSGGPYGQSFPALDRPVKLAGKLSAGAEITEITAGHSFHCVLTSDGEVACWGRTTPGYNASASGAANEPWLLVPKTGILGGEKVVDIEAGAAHLCALTESGRMACWGDNLRGELGTGSTTPTEQPFATTGAAPVEAAAVTNKLQSGERIIKMVGGGLGKPTTGNSGSFGFGCVLTSADRLLCWGTNHSGQLGVGSTTNQIAPVVVPTVNGGKISAVAVADQHLCVQYSASRQIYCAGSSAYKQAGTSTGNILTLTDAQVPFVLGCPPGSTGTGGNLCTLPRNTTFYYRVTYTLNGLVVAGEWVPIRTGSG